MLVAVFTDETCEIPYRSPSFVGPKVVIQIPRGHFPEKGEFELGCTPVDAKAPYSSRFQVRAES